MINKKLTHNIFSFLIFNIKFYLNIKNNIIYNFKIFVNKLNLNNIIFLNHIKSIKFNNIFNIRNKLNFNKSKHNLMPDKKKTGRARLGSPSSCLLKKGTVWYGLRNIKTKKYKYDSNLLKYLIFYKKNIISINNLEIIKFLYNLNSLKSYALNKIINTSYNNTIFLNFIKTYNILCSKNKNINIVY